MQQTSSASPIPSSASDVPARSGAVLRSGHAAASCDPSRKAESSTYMRWSTTAILRATATMAREASFQAAIGVADSLIGREGSEPKHGDLEPKANPPRTSISRTEINMRITPGVRRSSKGSGIGAGSSKAPSLDRRELRGSSKDVLLALHDCGQ